MEKRLNYLLENKLPVLLRLIRLELGITSKTLANWLNFSTYTTITDRETGAKPFSQKEYKKFKQVLAKNTGKNIIKLERKLSKKINKELIEKLYWKVFPKKKNSRELKNLLNIFTESQLTVLLNLYSQKCIEVIKNTNHIKLETINKIKEINQKLKKKEDPRKLYFLAWKKRILNNKYGLLCRLCREKLGITLSSLSKISNTTISTILSREIGTILMSKQFYSKIRKLFEEYPNFDNIEKQIKQSVKLKNNFLIKQIISFDINKYPIIGKLLPKNSFSEGRSKEQEIFNQLNKKYNVYWGARLLAKNLKKNEKEVDILLSDKNKLYAIEISNCNSKKLQYLNLIRIISRISGLKKRFQEINKFILLFPNLELTNQQKKRAYDSKIEIFDKTNLMKFLKDVHYSNKLVRKENKNEYLKIINKLKLTPYPLVLLLEDMGFKFRPNTLRGKSQNLYLQFFASQKVIKNQKRKTIFLNNSLYPYFKDLQMLARKKGLNYLHKKANYLFIKSGLSNVIRNKKDIEKMLNFDNVIKLVSCKNNKFEKQIANNLKRHRFEILQNVLVGSNDLLELNKRRKCPEVDIIAKKDKKYILVECKNQEKRKPSFGIQDLKRYIEKFSNSTKFINIKKYLITNLKVNYDVQDNIKNYAKEFNVGLKFVN